MSLKEVTLDAYLLATIYSQPLVPEVFISNRPAEKALPFLGKNKKNILLLIKNEENAFLSDQLFNFLVQILNACKISMEDVALVNLTHAPQHTGNDLIAQFAPRYIILFNTLPKDWITTPEKNKPAETDSAQILYTDDLAGLENDKELKIPFWTALQQLFNLK